MAITIRCLLLEDSHSKKRFAAGSRVRAREKSAGTVTSRGAVSSSTSTSYLVAGGHTRGLTDLRADRQHEPPTHGGDGAPIGVTLDRDANRWLLAGSQFGDDRGRHLDAGRGLACELDCCAKLHRFGLVALAVVGGTCSSCEKRM